METIECVAEMMVTLEDFSALLEQETAAIRAANIVIIRKLSENKQSLAWRYQGQLRQLAERGPELTQLPAEVKKPLRKAWEHFDTAMNDNVNSLEVAQYATRSVVNMIVSAIRDAQSMRGESTGAYQKSGAGRSVPKSDCVSVTLNQVL